MEARITIVEMVLVWLLAARESHGRLSGTWTCQRGRALRPQADRIREHSSCRYSAVSYRLEQRALRSW